MKNRHGEESRSYFRSERFFLVEDKHYFTTREGLEVGPFGSRMDAILGLERFIACFSANGCLHKARETALQGHWAATNYR